MWPGSASKWRTVQFGHTTQVFFTQNAIVNIIECEYVKTRLVARDIAIHFKLLGSG